MPTVIDHQVHWYPDTVVRRLMDRDGFPRVRTGPDGPVLEVGLGLTQPAMAALTRPVEAHIAAADAAGIGHVVIGAATLAEVLHLPADEAVGILDPLHRAYAEAVDAHPGRMTALASLPLQDADAALQVLERAADLGLGGVALLTANEGRPLGAAENLPVYARIAELGLPLFLHPGLRSTTADRVASAREEIGLSWMHQTARGALDLIDHGVLDAVPDLVVVHPHLGGVLPYVVDRIDSLPGGGARRPIRHYLRRNFVVDTAVHTPGALPLAIATYGIDRVVFASDHPFLDMGRQLRFLRDALPADQVERILANRVPGPSTADRRPDHGGTLR